MNTTPPTDSVTPLARRIGPAIAIGALVVTGALLAWLAVAPTAVAGPIEDAPFTVPGILVLPPDDAGCLRVVAGDGAVTTHCLDELAATEEGQAWVDVTFAADGDLAVFREGPDGRLVLRVDPGTGEVLDREEFTFDDDRFHERRDEVSEEPATGVDVPEGPVPVAEVYTDGDVVRRYAGGAGPGEDQEDDPVVLDLDAPPGYRLRDAALSPDGAWVVVTTPGDEVVVAPTDGSAAPHVWVQVPDDRWIDLRGAIRWDD